MGKSICEKDFFSVNLQVYEAELDRKYGIRLGDLKSGEESGFQGDLERIVSFRGEDLFSTAEIKDNILDRYTGIDGFCAMSVRDEEELEAHIKNVYELSYCHYVFGKESGMHVVDELDGTEWTFPTFCCINASRNLFLTLMEKGYPNAAFFYNKEHNHAYNGLPFVLGENNKKSFIIVDPTSDQLFDDKKNAPRNNVFVGFGEKWKYETDWADGADLFASVEDGSVFANLYTLRRFSSPSIWLRESVGQYFEKVFENTVDVEIKDF